MSNAIQQQNRVARLAHNNAHMEASFTDQKISDLSSKVENRIANANVICMIMSTEAIAKTMIAWFENADLPRTKEWSYYGALMSKFEDCLKIELGSSRSAIRFVKLLLPLISDKKRIINWFAHDDFAFEMDRVEDHRTGDFWAYQSRLALRGDWPALKQRAEKALSDSPTQDWLRKYNQDNQFYIALATGDVAGMEAYLAELCSPAVMRLRSWDESGFTRDLISTHGVIFAKMAWLHGHRVKVDSPYVPQEWLPIAPLDHYDYPFPFARELDVDTREEFATAWARKKPAPTVPDRV